MMDGRRIRRPRHDPVERVNLANDMPLTKTPDCGVARHGAYAGTVERDQHGGSAAASSGCGCFYAGMTCTDDNNVEHGFPLIASMRNVKTVPRGTSLPDTKSSKERVEQMLACIDPQDCRQRIPRQP
jgi:hypothetical protein